MKVRKVWIAIAIFNRRVTIVTRLAGSRLTFPTTFYPSLFELSKISSTYSYKKESNRMTVISAATVSAPAGDDLDLSGYC